MDTFTLNGIANCDTMKKARAWLAEHGVALHFHDYKKAGVDASALRGWCQALGWRALVNHRGTTWRKLSPEQQAIDSEDAAIQLMLDNPSLIKRPVLQAADGRLLLGFDSARYADFVAGGAGDGALPQ